jgi:hypothetical protein
MYDLTVFIYTDKNLKQSLGSYRAMFGVMPRVGDIIGSHVAIENCKTCRVEQVYVIPKATRDTTDADAIIKAVAVEKVDFP